MAWEVRTFAPDLLVPDAWHIEDLARAEPALAGVDVAVVEPREPVRVTHVLDAVEPRIRPDGRKAFPTEDRAGEGVTNRTGRPFMSSSALSESSTPSIRRSMNVA